jgi:hypothetical protein
MVIGLLVSRHRAKERDLSDLRYSLELFYLNEDESIYAMKDVRGRCKTLAPSARESFETCRWTLLAFLRINSDLLPYMVMEAGMDGIQLISRC